MQDALRSLLNTTFGEYVEGLHSLDMSTFPLKLRDLKLRPSKIQEELDEDGTFPFNITDGRIGTVTVSPGWMGTVEVVASDIVLNFSFSPMKAMRGAMKQDEPEDTYAQGPGQWDARGGPRRPPPPQQPPAPVPPRYCTDHGKSEQRMKVEPRFRECQSCRMKVQTNYSDFTLCPPCSDREQRCMLCGKQAPHAGNYVPAGQLGGPPVDEDRYGADRDRMGGLPPPPPGRRDDYGRDRDRDRYGGDGPRGCGGCGGGYGGRGFEDGLPPPPPPPPRSSRDRADRYGGEPDMSAPPPPPRPGSMDRPPFGRDGRDGQLDRTMPMRSTSSAMGMSRPPFGTASGDPSRDPHSPMNSMRPPRQGPPGPPGGPPFGSPARNGDFDRPIGPARGGVATGPAGLFPEDEWGVQSNLFSGFDSIVRALNVGNWANDILKGSCMNHGPYAVKNADRAYTDRGPAPPNYNSQVDLRNSDLGRYPN